MDGAPRMEDRMDDEPLEQWVERREERRPVRGERRLAPLGDQERGAHVDSHTPRAIQE
jgi:hypothetical protein